MNQSIVNGNNSQHELVETVYNISMFKGKIILNSKLQLQSLLAYQITSPKIRGGGGGRLQQQSTAASASSRSKCCQQQQW